MLLILLVACGPKEISLEHTIVQHEQEDETEMNNVEKETMTNNVANESEEAPVINEEQRADEHLKKTKRK